MVIRSLYNMAMWLLELLLNLDGLLGNKRASWQQGRKAHLKDAPNWSKLARDRNITWMHCASLGEYEQGITLLRALRKIKPEDFYLVSFFSPSGYEQRKNTTDADGVFYLPIDTPSNAKKLVEAIRPKIFIGVKYEFWWNLLEQLQRQNACILYIAVKLRPGHYFLRSGMTWFRKILTGITHFFTQDDASTQLLLSTGIAQVSTAGDTRVGGVMERKDSIKAISQLDTWKDRPEMTVIYASIYASDLPALETTLKRKDLFHIVVPHQVDPSNVEYLRKKLGCPSNLWTHFDAHSSANILVVDAIGHLFDLYAYADLVYVGGGFQKGVHNTLEPAVFGLPIAFGPRHQGFVETTAFLESVIATEIHTATDFENFIKQNQSTEIRQVISDKCNQYFQKNKGSLDHILAWLEQYYFKSQ